MPAHALHRSLDFGGVGNAVCHLRMRVWCGWLMAAFSQTTSGGWASHSYKSEWLSFIACATSVRNGFQFSPLNAALWFNAGPNPLHVSLCVRLVVTLVVSHLAAEHTDLAHSFSLPRYYILNTRQEHSKFQGDFPTGPISFTTLRQNNDSYSLGDGDRTQRGGEENFRTSQRRVLPLIRTWSLVLVFIP